MILARRGYQIIQFILKNDLGRDIKDLSVLKWPDFKEGIYINQFLTHFLIPMFCLVSLGSLKSHFKNLCYWKKAYLTEGTYLEIKVILDKIYKQSWEFMLRILSKGKNLKYKNAT